MQIQDKQVRKSTLLVDGRTDFGGKHRRTVVQRFSCGARDNYGDRCAGALRVIFAR